jgi:phage host-nuclease inhibitor protein Gam
MMTKLDIEQIENQNEFCRILAERVANDCENVTENATWYGKNKDAAYLTGHHRLRSDITRLRRELQNLSNMLGKGY